jgi:hypothetical protein
MGVGFNRERGSSFPCTLSYLHRVYHYTATAIPSRLKRSTPPNEKRKVSSNVHALRCVKTLHCYTHVRVKRCADGTSDSLNKGRI